MDTIETVATRFDRLFDSGVTITMAKKSTKIFRSVTKEQVHKSKFMTQLEHDPLQQDMQQSAEHAMKETCPD